MMLDEKSGPCECCMSVLRTWCTSMSRFWVFECGVQSSVNEQMQVVNWYFSFPSSPEELERWSLQDSERDCLALRFSAYNRQDGLLTPAGAVVQALPQPHLVHSQHPRNRTRTVSLIPTNLYGFPRFHNLIPVNIVLFSVLLNLDRRSAFFIRRT